MTILSIHSHLSYRLTRPCSLLLQLTAAEGTGQSVADARLICSGNPALLHVPADEGVGERVWLRTEGDFACDYTARVTLNRAAPALETLPKTPLTDLPGDVVKYLFASRYCPPDRFFDVTAREFGHLTGGAQIAAMAAWIKANLRYDITVSDATTDAAQTFEARAGVCRDFAHVLIAMARAVSIPARFASVYAPDVIPQDFHAVAEVYVGNAWYLVDPTGMARPEEMAVIGAGRDAADVSFLTSFGWIDLVEQWVKVDRITP